MPALHTTLAQSMPPDYTPAWIAAGVAVTVALITAWTAQRRLRQQLDNDRVQHREQLAHNAHRQRDQLEHDRGSLRDRLEHDRGLADLSELRAVLDEAAAMTWETIEQLVNAMTAADDWGQAALEADAEHAERVRDYRHRAFEPVWRLEPMLARLALRLGHDHDVVAVFAAFRAQAQVAVREIPRERPTRPGKERWGEIGPELGTLRDTFLRKAHGVVGSQLPR